MTTILKDAAYSLAFKNFATDNLGYKKPEGWAQHGCNLGISTIVYGSIGLVGHAILVVFAT